MLWRGSALPISRPRRPRRKCGARCVQRSGERHFAAQGSTISLGPAPIVRARAGADIEHSDVWYRGRRQRSGRSRYLDRADFHVAGNQEEARQEAAFEYRSRRAELCGLQAVSSSGANTANAPPIRVPAAQKIRAKVAWRRGAAPPTYRLMRHVVWQLSLVRWSATEPILTWWSRIWYALLVRA